MRLRQAKKICDKQASLRHNRYSMPQVRRALVRVAKRNGDPLRHLICCFNGSQEDYRYRIDSVHPLSLAPNSPSGSFYEHSQFVLRRIAENIGSPLCLLLDSPGGMVASTAELADVLS
jgi:hypothetical protein